MPEMLHVRIGRTGEERTISDVEPTRSAQLFWQISDGIWQKKPDTFRSAIFGVDSVMPAMKARDRLNEALSRIDESLVVSGAARAVKLNGFRRGGQLGLSTAQLAKPVDCMVGTYNWDYRGVERLAEIDGMVVPATFTDGHLDRSRELYAAFGYRDEGCRRTAQLTYAIQRTQGGQDGTTLISAKLWHSRFAETGYEGTLLGSAELSTEQEIGVLRVFQAIGGITIAAPQE